MKKLLMAASVALAFGTSAPASAVLIDFNGAAAGGQFNVGTLDWAPTSLLAINGNAAIASFAAGTCDLVSCNFDVLSHARLVGASDVNGNPIVIPGLNTSFEWTLTSRFTEMVTGVIPAAGLATFATVTAAPGFLNIFFDTATNSADLTGFGFNDGRLILAGTSVGDADGNFDVNTATAPVNLDQFPNPASNDYTGQLTVSGSGSNENIPVDTLTQDFAFFLQQLDLFGILFGNISQGLPYISVDPSDCFTPTATGVAVGGSTVGAQACANIHVNGPYSGQGADPNGGYVPIVGAVNGFFGAASNSPDFVAQTDFNSPLRAVPEPGTLALLGVALGALGLGARRRKQSA